MKMELIQPFINATDAVLGQTLRCQARIGQVCMENEPYRRHGVAALVKVHGDIEGRIIFDLDRPTAKNIATSLCGAEAESAEVMNETICELANLVIGNAVTNLNDHGFRFKVHPPELHSSDGMRSTEDSEALVMRFETPSGDVFMNIEMRYAAKN